MKTSKQVKYNNSKIELSIKIEQCIQKAEEQNNALKKIKQLIHKNNTENN